MITVALKGVFLMAKAARPVMMAQQRGVILNTATIDALIAEPGVDSYTAAKGGVVAPPAAWPSTTRNMTSA
jgi:NAD(P)-dependent dehydrogenase (short-subunit alcohol dehydrogenase family)